LIILNWSRLKLEEENLLNKKDVFEKSIIEREETLSQGIVKSKNEIKEIFNIFWVIGIKFIGIKT